MKKMEKRKKMTTDQKFLMEYVAIAVEKVCKERKHNNKTKKEKTEKAVDKNNDKLLSCSLAIKDKKKTVGWQVYCL